LRPLDWAVLLVLVYEVPSLLLSRYPANGLRAATTVCVAGLLYFLVRLVVRTSRQAVLMAALVGAGGVALAGFALMQFNEQVHLLKANSLTEIVAFRAKLIAPPAPWVLGEWFTLVLLTLPLASAVPVFLWLDRRRVLAASVAVMPIGIAAGLLLSCSRAVFWGLIVFTVVAVATAAAYRTIRTKVALIAIAGTLGALGLVLATENVFCPGVAGAYAGQQTSQARSTEGRLAIWKRSADIFKLSPVWGVGAGNAPLFLTSSADQEETTGFASRTFSLPIQVLTEKGVIGAALYLAVLVLAGWEAHRRLRNPKVSPQVKALTCCLVAGVVAVLFRELTYSSLLEHAATAMLFTMCLALLAAEEPA
jgi:O-antigen ligase